MRSRSRRERTAHAATHPVVRARHSASVRPTRAFRISRHFASGVVALPKPLAVFAYSDNDASRVLNACRAAFGLTPGQFRQRRN